MIDVLGTTRSFNQPLLRERDKDRELFHKIKTWTTQRSAVGSSDWLDDLLECTKDRLSRLLIITRGRAAKGGACPVEKAWSGYLSIFWVSTRIRRQQPICSRK